MRKLTYFTLSFFILLTFACSTKNDVRRSSFPLPVPERNSLLSDWEDKSVLDSLLIDDMELEGKWSETGIGEIMYTTERSIDGKQSLRFRTSLRDTAYIRDHRTTWGSFDGAYGGTSTVIMRFDKPQDWSAYNRLSFRVYVHPTSMPTYCLVIWLNNISKGSSGLKPSRGHFITDLKPGMWNHVIFEMPHLERDSIDYFSISQHLRGHNPEEEGIVTYDIDRLELQRVNAEHYEGWTVAPGKISFCHTGYTPDGDKTALVGDGGAESFCLVDLNGNKVFEGSVREIQEQKGEFSLIDFSDFKKEGTYRIKCGSLESEAFPVNKDVWLTPLLNAVNFYFCERCGYEVPGIHLECHKDWIGFRGDEEKIINGGWHDAGDLSQGTWRTAMGVYGLLRNLQELQDRKGFSGLSEKIRSEVKWGLEWLLKTRFGDGYRMSWSTMRIYTDNKAGTIDDVRTPARNVPWENFLTSAVESLAAVLLEKTDPELASKALIAAKEDWQAAVNSRASWTEADYREAAWGTISSVLLDRLTEDELYKEKAILFTDLLVQCQEQRFNDDIPITGYFYSNTSRQRIIRNSHTAFDECIMIALRTMCGEYPDHENWISWYSSAAIYSEYFMKRGSLVTAPYNYLPNSVWNISEITRTEDESERKILLDQYNDGTRLSDEYVLRTFPIYSKRAAHGSTNAHLSSAWSLAEASLLRMDEAGMALAGKQLQWVLGNNPFSQSLMYGTGYDFQPLSAHYLKNVVGAVPVGIDCIARDKPYWPATNYTTFKEIWTEPTSRFIGAVSVYAFNQKFKSPDENGIKTESIQNPDSTVTINIKYKGKGDYTIKVKTYNCEADKSEFQVDPTGKEPARIILKVNDKSKPYVAVICSADDPLIRSEITGSFINSQVLIK